MFKVFFEDLEVGSSEEYGEKLVDRDEVIAFATDFDPQGFHLDDEAAKNSPFGRLCASGWHTAAMTMRMIVDNLKRTGYAGMGSPGLDQLRWRRPVFPGDVLRVRSTVLEKGSMPKRPALGVVKNQAEVLNQDDEVVMTMVSNVMVLRREPLPE